MCIRDRDWGTVVSSPSGVWAASAFWAYLKPTEQSIKSSIFWPTQAEFNTFAWKFTFLQYLRCNIFCSSGGHSGLAGGGTAPLGYRPAWFQLGHDIKTYDQINQSVNKSFICSEQHKKQVNTQYNVEQDTKAWSTYRCLKLSLIIKTWCYFTENCRLSLGLG